MERWAEEADKRTPDMHDKPRSGRPCKFSPRQVKAVRRAFTPKRSPGKVARALTARGTVKISEGSVRRIWATARHPITYMKIIRPKRLSDINKQKRMAFAQHHMPTESTPWAFTDGKMCSLYLRDDGNFTCHWQKAGTTPSSDKNGLVARFFFYAVVGTGLKSDLIFTAPSPKKGTGLATGGRAFISSDYISLMRRFRKPLGIWRPGGRYFLIRDRARQHTSAESDRALSPLNLPILEAFPPQSWDINCIEHVWAQLSQKLRHHRARTPDGFRRAVLKAWDSISQETIDAIVEKVPGRLKKIAALKGEWIGKYKDACKSKF